jgi:ferredoxin
MAKYRIEIDREACVGDGACCDSAPGTFELDDDTIAVVKSPEGDPPETILEAAQGCPTDAIVLFDAETGEKVWPEED